MYAAPLMCLMLLLFYFNINWCVKCYLYLGLKKTESIVLSLISIDTWYKLILINLLLGLCICIWLRIENIHTKLYKSYYGISVGHFIFRENIIIRHIFHFQSNGVDFSSKFPVVRILGCWVRNRRQKWEGVQNHSNA